MSAIIRVGARDSRLSRWQAEHARRALLNDGLQSTLELISTSGDRDLQTSIEDLPGDAPFVDDLEDALRARRIDVAVHSLKDVPSRQAADLLIAALLPRGAASESLVSRHRLNLSQLQPGAVIGTSSSRRRAHILWKRPDLHCLPIRGPVESRVAQVLAGQFDAAILATAGLERLALTDAIAETFPIDDFLPAAGQGALALQIRANDHPLAGRLGRLDDFATRVAAIAELEAQRRIEAEGLVAATHATADHVAVAVRVRAFDRGAAEPVEGFASGVDPQRVAIEAVERALQTLPSGTVTCHER